MSEFPYACKIFGCVQPAQEGEAHCRIHLSMRAAPKDDLQRVAGTVPEVGVADLLRGRAEAKLAALETRTKKLEAVADAVRSRMPHPVSSLCDCGLCHPLAALDEEFCDAED